MGEWSPAIGHRIPGFSPDINGKAKSEEDILADLLLTPNLLSSPHLSASIKQYLDGRGSNEPSPMLSARPHGFQSAGTYQPGPANPYGRTYGVQSQFHANPMVSAPTMLQHAQPTQALPSFTRRAGASWQGLPTHSLPQAVSAPKL